MSEGYKSTLETIYRSHYDRYIRYTEYIMYTYTGVIDKAEDIVHQAFLLALEKEKQSSKNPESWLMVTIKYICMNHLKQYRVRQPILESLYNGQPKEAASCSSSVDILLSLEQELPPDDYKILYDYTLNGKSVDELSKETGMTPNNLRVRIYRIREAARKIIFSLLVIFTLFQEI